MAEMEEVAKKVFALLKGNNLQIKIFDEMGAETTDPTQGRRFFVAKPNMMVTISEDSIEFSKGAEVSHTYKMGKDAHIVDIKLLQKSIRKIADEFLMNLDIKVFGKNIQPRDYAYQAKMNKGDTMMENNAVKPYNHQLMGKILHIIKTEGSISADTLAYDLDLDLSDILPVLNRLVTTGKLQAENTGNGIEYCTAVEEAVMESFSKMFGSLKTSQQTLENVRILVRHKTPVDENVRGSRSRSISAIFLECNGERMRFQHNHLAGARAMAQHMAHGGTMSDKVGAYISESTGQLLKLQSFNRYVTTNKLINEDSSGIIETIKENIQTLRTELKKLTGSKTYETVKARLETFEREALAEDDVSQLKELFTIRRFDEKFEEVLPIVKQLVYERDTFYKRIEEAAASTVIVRRETMSAPIFEFASENARLGFKLNEFALRIIENEELSSFVGKIGTKLCKEGIVNDFEKAVMRQVLENVRLSEKAVEKKEIKESIDIMVYFDRFDYKFM